MAQGEHVSMHEYARRRAARGLTGKTPPAVHKAIAAGRLSASVVRTPEGKFLGILPDVADREWSAGTDAAQQRVEPSGGRPPRQEKLFGEQREPEPQGGPNPSLTYQRARAFRESFVARLAEVEYKHRVSLLVDAEEVRRDAAAVGRKVRDAVMAVAQSLDDELEAAGVAQPVRTRVREELVSALRALAASA